MNKIDYFEIGSPHAKAAGEFYGSLFGWQVEEPTGPAKYGMVNGGDGGLWDTSDIGGQHWAIFYVHVDDVAAAVEQAQQLGATVAMPVIDNANITFAHLVDPDGNRFGVWRPNDQS